MQIIIPSQSLKESLRLASRGVRRNSPLPVLANVKLDTDSDLGLNITATDYDLEIKTAVGCKVEKPGQITLPAKQFLEIAGAVSGNEVKITVGDDLQATIQSGRSRHKLAGMDPNEFPLLPETKDETGLILPQFLLKDILHKTIHAVSKDDTRPGMTGGRFKVKGTSAELAATDGHRLMIYGLSFDGDTGRDIQAIIPRRSMIEMLHFLSSDEEEDVEVKVDECQIEFVTRLYTIKSRLVAGTFPNTEKPIEIVRENPYDATYNRVALIEALKRMDIIAREDEDAPHRTHWQIGPKLMISAQAKGLGLCDETIEAIEGNDTAEIWLRADQMLEMLNAFDSSNVVVSFSTSNRPIIVFPGDAAYFGILMPIVGPTGGDE